MRKKILAVMLTLSLAMTILPAGVLAMDEGYEPAQGAEEQAQQEQEQMTQPSQEEQQEQMTQPSQEEQQEQAMPLQEPAPEANTFEVKITNFRTEFGEEYVTSGTVTASGTSLVSQSVDGETVTLVLNKKMDEADPEYDLTITFTPDPAEGFTLYSVDVGTPGHARSVTGAIDVDPATYVGTYAWTLKEGDEMQVAWEPNQITVWYHLNDAVCNAFNGADWGKPAVVGGIPYNIDTEWVLESDFAQVVQPGYEIVGWCLDSKLTKPYDFKTPVTDETFHLYAKWENKDNGEVVIKDDNSVVDPAKTKETLLDCRKEILKDITDGKTPVGMTVDGAEKVSMKLSEGEEPVLALDIEQNKASEDAKIRIADFLKVADPKAEVLQYTGITVYFEDGNGVKIADVTELSKNLTFSVSIPEDQTYKKTDKFGIVRDHQMKSDVVDSETDENPSKIKFYSSKFSTFALYRSPASDSSKDKKTTGAKTGDNNLTGLWVVVLLMAAGVIAGMCVRRRKK